MSFRAAVLLAICACSPAKVPSEHEDTATPSGDDSGEIDAETGGDETGGETGETGDDTGLETGGETGGETGDETGDTATETGGETTGEPPVSSRCIEDGDTIGACTNGVYAEDWSGSVRYEWVVTDGYNHSVLTATDGDEVTRIAMIQTQSSWHMTGGLTVMPDGDLLLAGITLPYVRLTINDDTVNLGEDYVRFLARISPDGDLRWVKTIVGITGESIVVAARSDGSAVVSGFLYVATSFDDYVIDTTMFFDLAFAAAISEDGDWLWASAPVMSTGSARAYFDDMTLNSDESASVDLRYTGTIELDSGSYTCATGATCAGTATVSADGAWTDLVAR